MVEKRVKTEPAQNEVESKKAKWSKKTDAKKDIKKEFKGEYKGKKDFKKGIFESPGESRKLIAYYRVIFFLTRK